MGRKTAVAAPSFPAGLVPVMHRSERINPAGGGLSRALTDQGPWQTMERQSQVMSIYRKLGTPSRSQAVARSRELGLLEG